jgi:hypothetical protein
MYLLEKSTRLSIILAIVVLFAAPVLACDNIKGWGPMKWGDSFENFKDDLIEIKSDTFTIDGMEINLAAYFMKNFPVPEWVKQPYFVFLDGKFASTAIFIKDDLGTLAFAEALCDTCGKPTKMTNNTMIWVGRYTLAVLDKKRRLLLIGDPPAMLIINELLSDWASRMKLYSYFF